MKNFNSAFPELKCVSEFEMSVMFNYKWLLTTEKHMMCNQVNKYK